MFISKVELYFLKQFTRVLLTTLVLSSLLTWVVDFAEVARVMFHNTSKDKLLLLTAAKTTNNMIQLMPLVVLISVISTFSILNKKNEMVVLASLGVSPSSFLIIIFSTLIVLYIFVITLLLPLNNQLSVASEKIIPKTKEAGVFFKSLGTNLFIKSEKINYGSPTQLFDVTVWVLNQDFSLIETINTQKAVMEDSRLILYDAISITEEKREQLPQKSLSLDVTAQDIFASTSKPEQVNLFALPSFIKTLSKLGWNSSQHKRYFHDKITLIISFFTMALVGFGAAYDFSARFARKKQFFYGVILGLSIFFANNLISSIFLSQSYSIGFSILLARLILLSVAIGYVKNSLVK